MKSSSQLLNRFCELRIGCSQDQPDPTIRAHDQDPGTPALLALMSPRGSVPVKDILRKVREAKQALKVNAQEVIESFSDQDADPSQADPIQDAHAIQDADAAIQDADPAQDVDPTQEDHPHASEPAPKRAKRVKKSKKDPLFALKHCTHC